MDYSINNILSPELRVKELAEDQNAIYKLCDSDTTDPSRVDENTGKPKQCQPRWAGRKKETIYDPFQKKSVVIMNITGIKHEEIPGQGLREIPIAERPIFPHTGMLTLGAEHQGTYAFLERHPRNRDNPFRDKNQVPKFYRVNAKKQAIKDMENSFILLDALNHVRDADQTELRTIYDSLDANLKRDVNSNSAEALKRDIFKLAQKHPIQVMQASSNKPARMKIQIMDAEHFNIITFLEDEEDDKMPRRWVFTGTREDICQLDITKHKIDGLLEYFLSDDEAIKKYQMIVKSLKKVLQPNLQPA